MSAAGTHEQPIELDSDDDIVDGEVLHNLSKSADSLARTQGRTNRLDQLGSSAVDAKDKEPTQSEQPAQPQPTNLGQVQPNARGPNVHPVHNHINHFHYIDHFHNNDPFLQQYIHQQYLNNPFRTAPGNFTGNMRLPHGFHLPFFHRNNAGPENLIPRGPPVLVLPQPYHPRNHYHGGEHYQVGLPLLPPEMQFRRNPAENRQVQQQDQRQNKHEENKHADTPEVVIDQGNFQACLDRILELFPTISHAYVFERYKNCVKQHQQDNGNRTHSPSASIPFEVIIEDILESGENYPEEASKKRKREPDADEHATKIDYENVDGNRSNTYILDATQILAADFSYIPTRHINSVVILNQSLFKAYQILRAQDHESRTLPKGGQKPFRRLKKPRMILEKKYTPKPCDGVNDKDYKRTLDEYQAAQKHWQDEDLRRQRQRESNDLEAANFAQAQQDDALVDCKICYDSFPLNRSISCEGNEIHFFCYGCVEQYAKTQIGMMRFTMDCMCCGEPLSRNFLTHALDAKTLNRLEDLQQRQEIKDAELEGLDECPFCEFRAQCPPVEIDKVFNCENCEAVSCRLCRKEAHLPLSCEEATEDSRLARRHRVEEAMSASLLRRCPKCDIPIVKSDGCNKITCPAGGCRALICFVCKADITAVGYTHFRGSNPYDQNRSKCPLHDAQNNRNEEDVRRAEQGQIRELREAHAGLGDEDLEVSRHIRF